MPELLFTPRQMGKVLGASANITNLQLQSFGLQWRDENGDWRLTDKGLPYGREFVIYQKRRRFYVRWRESALNWLAKHDEAMRAIARICAESENGS